MVPDATTYDKPPRVRHGPHGKSQDTAATKPAPKRDRIRSYMPGFGAPIPHGVGTAEHCPGCIDRPARTCAACGGPTAHVLDAGACALTLCRRCYADLLDIRRDADAPPAADGEAPPASPVTAPRQPAKVTALAVAVPLPWAESEGAA